MKITQDKEFEVNTFLQKYIDEDPTVKELFDYSISNEAARQRAQEVAKRSYQREELVNVLTDFNKKYTDSKKTFQQIQRLNDPASVVVVGGQQAGLLTGPLYTVNKVASILHEATTLERELSIPVIPVFWIAGEDHDIEEVNHTFLHHKNKIKKLKIDERNDWKAPVSNRIIKKETGKALIKEAFQFLHETEHSKNLLTQLYGDMSEDKSYVDWFSLIIHRLFKDSGIVLMDAQDGKIRELEEDYFKEMIKRNDDLRTAFTAGARQMKQSGFGEPIVTQEENAHLFIHDGNERFLLEKRDSFFCKKGSWEKWTEEELLDKVTHDSSAVSNNVVTRPVMQDLLLPVLAFVAGPGELKYWGTLKQVFHTFGIGMPLIYPRLHITFLSRRTEKYLAWMDQGPSLVAREGVEQVRDQWLKDHLSVDVAASFQEAEAKFALIERELGKSLSELGDGVSQLHRPYSEKINRIMEEYKRSVERSLRVKNEGVLKKFACVETEIIPNGNMQERYLNVIPFLNDYGEDLIQRLMKNLDEQESLIGKHIYIYL